MSRISPTPSEKPEYRLPPEQAGLPTPGALPDRFDAPATQPDARLLHELEKEASPQSVFNQVSHDLGHGLSPHLASILALINKDPAYKLGQALSSKGRILPGGSFGPHMMRPEEFFSTHITLKGRVAPDDVSSIGLLPILAIAHTLAKKGIKPSISPRMEKWIESIVSQLKKPLNGLDLENLLKNPPE